MGAISRCIFCVFRCVMKVLIEIRVLEMQGGNAGEALDGAAGGPLHLCLVLETSTSSSMYS